MPKSPIAKSYIVDYKVVNTALKKKRAELKLLQKKVSLPSKLDLELQIKAMDLIISKCTSGKMSKKYEGA